MPALQLFEHNFHQLSLEGRQLLFHIPTSALFELDGVTGTVLDWLRQRGPARAEDVRQRFDGVYEPETVVRVLCELRELGIVGEPSSPAPRALPAIRHYPLSTIVLNVNTGCNLSCTYCYKEDLATPAGGRKMDPATAFGGIDLLLKESAGRERINVIFFGGEPLTNLPLIKQVVAYAEERCRTAGVAVDFSLTTNATLLTEASIDYLNAHRFGLSVSMDGPKAMHDRHRLSVGGKGTYDLVVRKVRMLLARYTARPVGARVTLSRGNTDVAAIHQHLREELGFAEVGFAPTTAADQAAFNLTEAELADVFAGLKELGRRYLEAALRDENIGFSNMQQLMTDLWQGTRKALPCGAGVGLLAVDSQGGLNLCHRFTGSALPTFGTVQSGIDKDNLGHFLDNMMDRSGYPCVTCRIRTLCAGGCYHESYARYGDPAKPVYHYCELLRDWVDFGIAVYARLQAGNPAFFAHSIAPGRRH